jgi:hypothetical protein
VPSSAIRIAAVAGAGRRLIRRLLTDGCGLAPATIALPRSYRRANATSKLSRRPHLLSISTLAFRGEVTPVPLRPSPRLNAQKPGRTEETTGTPIEISGGEEFLTLRWSALATARNLTVRRLVLHVPATQEVSAYRANRTGASSPRSPRTIPSRIRAKAFETPPQTAANCSPSPVSSLRLDRVFQVSSARLTVGRVDSTSASPSANSLGRGFEEGSPEAQLNAYRGFRLRGRSAEASIANSIRPVRQRPASFATASCSTRSTPHITDQLHRNRLSVRAALPRVPLPKKVDSTCTRPKTEVSVPPGSVTQDFVRDAIKTGPSTRRVPSRASRWPASPHPGGGGPGDASFHYSEFHPAHCGLGLPATGNRSHPPATAIADAAPKLEVRQAQPYAPAAARASTSTV